MANEERLSAVLEKFVFGLFVAARSDSVNQLVELDLQLSQARTLFTVGHHDGPLPIHAIAEKLTMSVTAAGRNIDSLVRLGLLTREESQGDRRVKLVGLTEQGRSLICDHVALQRTSLDEFVARLSDPLRADLCTALTAVLESGALNQQETASSSSGDDT